MGCGALPAADPPFPGGEPRATIVVDNFETGHLGVSVFATGTTGGTYRLGTVSTTASTSLVFRNFREGEFVLEARISGEAPLRSRAIFIRDGDAIEWNLRDNRVWYR